MLIGKILPSFYKMYGEEMACTEDGFHLPYLIYDDDFEGWIKFVASFYEENGMQDKLVSLYLNLEDTSFSMAKFEVAAALLGDNSEYNPFCMKLMNLLTSGWMNALIIQYWKMWITGRCMTSYTAYWMSILVKRLYQLLWSWIKQTLAKKEITSAIKWLLKQRSV